MNAPYTVAQPAPPLPPQMLMALALGLALAGGMVFAALTLGTAVAACVLMVPASLLAVRYPVVLIACPLLLAPLLGRTSDMQLGPFNAMALIALWLTVLGGLCVVQRGRWLLRDRIFVPQLAMLLLIGASVAVSSQRGVSVAEFVRASAAAMMLAIAYLHAGSLRGRKELVALVVASALLPLAVGCYQMLTGDVDHGLRATMFEIESGIVRIYATFWDVHPYAKFLLVLAPLVLVFTQAADNLRDRMLGAALLATLLLNLAYTYARSQFIGFLIALLLILFVRGRLRIRTLLALVPLVLLFAWATGVTDRFADLFQAVDLQSAERENSLESRFLIWSQGFLLAIQKPILGHGAATFDLDIGIQSHNVYLGLFYELGLLGPLVYGWFLLMAWRYAVACSQALLVSRFDRNVAVSMCGITGAIAVVSLVENYAQATTMWWPYFALLACVAGALREAALRLQQDSRGAIPV